MRASRGREAGQLVGRQHLGGTSESAEGQGGVQNGREGGSWADGVWGGPGGLGGGWQGGEAQAPWSGAPRRGLRVAGGEEAGSGGLTVGGERGCAGTTTWEHRPSREGDVLWKGVAEGPQGLGGVERWGGVHPWWRRPWGAGAVGSAHFFESGSQIGVGCRARGR